MYLPHYLADVCSFLPGLYFTQPAISLGPQWALAICSEHISNLRTEAVREFRSMERTHPITPDRLRAAFMLIGTQTATNTPSRPAAELLIPAGETSAESVERELTTVLFA